MDENRPTVEPQPAPATFSLRTLFLTLTTSGVFFAVLRVADGFWACLATSAFLTAWFAVTRQSERAKLAWIAMLVFLWVAGLMSTSSPASHENARGVQCGNNLKQIGLAVLAYQQVYGSFPPAYTADANGKPLLSWRTLILPQMDNLNLAKQIRGDEAWDGPNNAKMTDTSPLVFRCPADASSGPSTAFTDYVAVVGPHTAWSGATPRKLSEFKNPSGTILVIEIAHSGIHWAEPRDLYIGQMPMSVNPKVGQGISSDHADGVNAVFVDGSVHFIPNSINPKTLAELLDLDGCSDPSAY